MLVGEEPVELREGAVTNVTIRAPKIMEFVERLCEEKLPKDDNGILRVLVIDRVTSRPLPNLRVWLRWAGSFIGSMERPGTLRPSKVGGTEAMTDTTCWSGSTKAGCTKRPGAATAVAGATTANACVQRER